MRTLFVTVALFFSIFAGVIVYFALSDEGQEYDFKFVLPIDTRQMPKAIEPPQVVAQTGSPIAYAVTDGRATEGTAPDVSGRPLISFGNRPGAASEARSPE